MFASWHSPGWLVFHVGCQKHHTPAVGLHDLFPSLQNSKLCVNPLSCLVMLSVLHLGACFWPFFTMYSRLCILSVSPVNSKCQIELSTEEFTGTGFMSAPLYMYSWYQP